jgi:hypothetical protein
MERHGLPLPSNWPPGLPPSELPTDLFGVLGLVRTRPALCPASSLLPGPAGLLPPRFLARTVTGTAVAVQHLHVSAGCQRAGWLLHMPCQSTCCQA